ncbi:hypothetical protein IWX49DRAFT_388808 [Phyllosticta citricarpa]
MELKASDECVARQVWTRRFHFQSLGQMNACQHHASSLSTSLPEHPLPPIELQASDKYISQQFDSTTAPLQAILPSAITRPIAIGRSLPAASRCRWLEQQRMRYYWNPSSIVFPNKPRVIKSPSSQTRPLLLLTALSLSAALILTIRFLLLQVYIISNSPPLAVGRPLAYPILLWRTRTFNNQGVLHSTTTS